MPSSPRVIAAEPGPIASEPAPSFCEPDFARFWSMARAGPWVFRLPMLDPRDQGFAAAAARRDQKAVLEVAAGTKGLEVAAHERWQ